ncbi:uncharacterized protein LOC113854230 [Abrus precatorius]|uniref:Uncharacterized protein LOC113854230 n=1 Tax=Abrus precatorius TaxID=3816 RepID=A0A8B8KB35_ABRPR|nr:uncharacterized protein LOC113854230 [Abrus precatorius]
MASKGCTAGDGTGVGGSECGATGSNVVHVDEERSRKNKNATRVRRDVGWTHGVSVDGDSRKIKCKYCEKEITGGVYRFKHHLAGIKKDVVPCIFVPDDVKKQMWDVVTSKKEKSIQKANPRGSKGDDVSRDAAGKRKMHEEQNPSDLFNKIGVSSQDTIDSISETSLREEACLAISSFLYNNAIPFNVVKSEEFHKMCELIAENGIGFKPPSCHEVSVKYLKQKLEITKQVVEKHRAVWKKSGCTIIADEWTDKKKVILNFFVNSPMGTVFLKSIDASIITKTTDQFFKMIDDVVEEVGEKHVVQVITHSSANYKAVGELLMEKRKNLYWTPCAAHCIDLILEDFEKKLPLHQETIGTGKKVTTYIYSSSTLISLLHHFTNGKDLVRPAITRFAASYLTLQCLNENKEALMRMFTSEQWKSSQVAKTKEGKHIENLVIDKEFWKNILNCLKGAYPLIQVLQLVDLDDKPAMGFVYEEMDQAKERIEKAFGGVKKCYMPLWEIIDEWWDNQLHRPLHAAGYYLNPILHYSSNFKVDVEVKHGLYECLERLGGDLHLVNKIDGQLEDFKSRSGYFGSRVAELGLTNKTPIQWWESYGDEYPELQKFAIRILSLTCSSSSCERNWSVFEKVHVKKRNHLKQKAINDAVFVMANSRLCAKKSKKEVFNIEDIPSDDDWIVENNQNLDLEMDILAKGNLIQVGEDDNAGSANGGAPLQDDFEVPDVADDEICDGEDATNEDETEDDYEN